MPRLLLATIDQQQAELREAGEAWYESLPMQAEHPAEICVERRATTFRRHAVLRVYDA